MTNQQQPVRVRFAPSPTGHLHIGGARTAVYNYLLAKKMGGQFILRIEDTDRRRFMPGTEEEIIDGLHWLGVDWDEGPDKDGPYGPYRQSERKQLYLQYGQDLIEKGAAYYCFCTPQRLEHLREEQQKNKETTRYDGACRNIPLDEAKARVAAGEAHVIRFKSPEEGATTVHDLLRGDITVENKLLDDYILVKSDGLALYHLAAAVDDHLMKITHVIRGSEWLSTFPLHGLIQRAFGWVEPVWVHLSVFLKPSGKGKMSKRETADLIKDGYSFFVKDMKGLGYLPEAVVNWIALMGWSYDDHTEFFAMDDLVEKFSLEKLNPSPAAINYSKLDHFNGLHIRTLSAAELANQIQPFLKEKGLDADMALLLQIAPIIQERLVTLDDAVELSTVYFEQAVHPNPEDLIVPGLSVEDSLILVKKIRSIFENLPNLHPDTAEPPMRQLVDESGLKAGQVFGQVRIAVTGRRVSPPLFESIEILGKEKVINRLNQAADLLENLADQK